MMQAPQFGPVFVRAQPAAPLPSPRKQPESLLDIMELA